jgi:DNA polymerase epsilon subunit 1
VQNSPERSGVDLYFASEDNRRRPFVATVLFRPYFYVLPDWDGLDHNQQQQQQQQLPVLLELVATHLRNAYEPLGLYSVETVQRQDLDQPNHLSPSKRHGRVMLKLVFDTTAQMSEVRHALQDLVAANVARGRPAASVSWDGSGGSNTMTATMDEPLRCLTDLREYDVPYVVRVCTDLDIRAGCWYTVRWEHELYTSEASPPESLLSTADLVTTDVFAQTGGVRLMDPDRERKAEPVVLAFDIECTKAPLKFPRADVDEIFMISYMVFDPAAGRAQGYLITSRSVVSADVQDFEYTPKPSYPGPFQIFNEADEKALLNRFFGEFRRHCPQIVVTYNGDFFDFPFVDARAQHHSLDLFREIGLSQTSSGSGKNNDSGGYRGRWTVHLDAFHWVQRDSYLPQGAQGLKAVTKYKLGYDPVEVDPEDMLRFAHEKPVHMATYSVSDAVATYYLYDKYVHLFIFSLATMIPMGPEDVLSKGSGTLCEALLMVQACKKNIICPNKQVDAATQFHKGHLLEAETYIGGKVECLESGVFRSDLLYDFDLKPSAFQQLIDNLDRDLTFTIEVENGKLRKDIVNYDEVGSLVGTLCGPSDWF